MIKQGNMTPLKIQLTVTNTNDSEEDEILDNDHTMIDKIEEHMNNSLNEFQKDSKS
jgi:hypothetical protein